MSLRVLDGFGLSLVNMIKLSLDMIFGKRPYLTLAFACAT